MVSSAYLWLLIFLLAILIPACASSSPVFHMRYSAYKLNKQGDNIQPSRTPSLFGTSLLFHVQLELLLLDLDVQIATRFFKSFYLYFIMLYEYIVYLYLLSCIIFGQDRIHSHNFSGGYKHFKYFNISYIHVQ